MYQNKQKGYDINVISSMFIKEISQDKQSLKEHELLHYLEIGYCHYFRILFLNVKLIF